MKNRMKTVASGALVALILGVSFAFAEEHCGAGIGGGSGGNASAIVVNGGTITARGGGMSEVARGGRDLHISLPAGSTRETLYNDVVSNEREVGHYKATLAAGDSPTGTPDLGFFEVHDLGDGDCFIEAMMKNGDVYSCSRAAGVWTSWGGGDGLKAEAKDEIYPVGSTYMNVGNDLPASIQAIGTWERIASGLFLMAGNGSDAGGTGGAAAVTLSVEQLPAHNHQVVGSTDNGGTHVHYFKGYYGIDSGTKADDRFARSYKLETEDEVGQSTTANSGAHNHKMEFSSQNTGSGWAHENRPPYLTVSIWKRTN